MMNAMMKPSPLNARVLRLMKETGCLIFWKNDRISYRRIPTIGKYDEDAHVVGKGIKLQPRNMDKMLKEGWIILARPAERDFDDDGYAITVQGLAAVSDLGAKDFQPSTKKPYFTADEIKAILREWHIVDGGWIFLTELAIEGRRLDAYALGLWRSTKWLSVGYEIKTNRADLISDFENRSKRIPAMRHCHQFYYVTTKGLAHHTEFPVGCGLIEIWKDKSRHVVMDAPLRNIASPTWQFAGIIARRSAREHHRRYDFNKGEWVGTCRSEEIPKAEEAIDG